MSVTITTPQVSRDLCIGWDWASPKIYGNITKSVTTATTFVQDDPTGKTITRRQLNSCAEHPTKVGCQEYMTDIKKTPKQKAAFENALQKRTAIKVDSISADFISLGTIWKSIQHKDYCEMNFAPQYTFKSQSTKSCGERNDEIWFNNFDLSEEVSSIVVRKKGKCFEQNQMFKADYFVGHYEDSKLFFDTSYSSWDYIYSKGKMIDISFGLSFEKFISYL